MLIEKPPPPLEVAAKESDKKIRIKTIRHTDCIEVGHRAHHATAMIVISGCDKVGAAALMPLARTAAKPDLAMQPFRANVLPVIDRPCIPIYLVSSYAFMCFAA